MKISRYRLFRLEVPTGRPIGDCACRYEKFIVLALAIENGDGLSGWGFGETVSDGVYSRPAPWRSSLPGETELGATFEADYWPWLKDIDTAVALERARARAGSYSPFNCALRLALWDLRARELQLPLHRFLGGDGRRTRIRAYGSPLDFHMSDDESVQANLGFVRRGFSAVKVKVGHPDAQRDLRRLLKVRAAIGPAVELSVDANEGWTCEQAIERISLFEKHGVGLAYVEDALPLSDVDGFARLARAVPVDLAAHDYATSSAELRALLERGCLRRLRASGDIDLAMECGALAREFGIPIIVGNSMFERNVHVAAALPEVERIEFADLAWNRLVAAPVRFEQGEAIVPQRPGHGLEASPRALELYRRPEPGESAIRL